MNNRKNLPILNIKSRKTLIDKQKSLLNDDAPLFKVRSSTARLKFKPSPIVSQTDTRTKFFQTLKSFPTQFRKGFSAESPTEIFLKECEIKNLNPLPIGTNPDSSSIIDISNYRMGDNYAEAFGKSLTKVSSIEKLNISSNSLSPRGLSSILKNLSIQPLKELSMKDNIFDIRLLTPLLEILNKPSPCLRYLNLENTKISDRFVAVLCDSLASDHTLNFLGLAKNSLSYISCRAIKAMLIENQYLKQLDFHWNNSKDYGAVLIFEGLMKNDTLKELDLSWNSIGKNNENFNVSKLSETFLAIQGLVHLDLSFNFLTPNECQILGDGLLKNTEILGIHFLGNQGVIDNQGFILPMGSIVPSQQNNLFFRMFDVGKGKCSAVSESLCWICDGWKEMEFIYDPVKENKHDIEELFIHMDCDGFKPDSLLKKNGTFQLPRVLPSGDVQFFFSDGKKVIESAQYEKVELETPITQSVEFIKDQTIEFLIKSLNTAKVVGNVFSPILPFKSIPRKPKFSVKTVKIEERINWKVPKSLFRGYQLLTPQHINECLEFDWKESKLDKLVKSELEKSNLMGVLRKHYTKLTEIFRYLASQSANDYLTVGNNVLTDFLYQSKIFDSIYTQADLGVNWNAVTVHRSRQPYNPITSLVRYEFIELLIRITQDRYLRNKISSSLSEGLEKLMSEKLGQNFQLNLSNNWRTQVYLTEDVDIVFKTHRPILENIYKKFSGKKTLPGQKPFMSLEEFKDLCLKADLIQTNNPEHELELCFGAAMMIYVDEIYQKKHVEMKFVEFLEAIARVSTYRVLNEKGGDLLPRQIEGTLTALIKLCSRSLRENFTFPTLETYKAHKFKLKL